MAVKTDIRVLMWVLRHQCRLGKYQIAEMVMKAGIFQSLLKSSCADLKYLAGSSSGNNMNAALIEFADHADSFAVFRSSYTEGCIESDP